VTKTKFIFVCSVVGYLTGSAACWTTRNLRWITCRHTYYSVPHTFQTQSAAERPSCHALNLRKSDQ